jgi:hypothetical protein
MADAFTKQQVADAFGVTVEEMDALGAESGYDEARRQAEAEREAFIASLLTQRIAFGDGYFLTWAEQQD